MVSTSQFHKETVLPTTDKYINRSVDQNTRYRVTEFPLSEAVGREQHLCTAAEWIRPYEYGGAERRFADD